MAVKVVSEGPVKTYKVICQKCCYELEYTPVDVQSNSHTDYGGGSDTYYFILCPRQECKDRVDVKSPGL